MSGTDDLDRFIFESLENTGLLGEHIPSMTWNNETGAFKATDLLAYHDHDGEPHLTIGHLDIDHPIQHSFNQDRRTQ